MSHRASVVHAVRLAVCLIATPLLAGAPSRAGASTTISGGDVVGQTWTAAGSPYVVEGDVTVPAGATLTIEAGTVVQFAGTDGQAAGIDASRVELTVHGTLTVSGTAQAPVTFQAQSSTAAAAWYGIVAASDATSVSIAGALIEHASYGITAASAGSRLAVASSTLRTSGTGILVNSGAPTFTGVTVSGSEHGFYVAGSGAPTLTNCIAQGSAGSGVHVFPTSGTPRTVLSGCTLHGNGSGVYVASAGGTPDVVIENSLVTGNGLGVYRGAGTVAVSYSSLWGNGISTEGLAVGSTSHMQYCNPLYVDPPSNLRLTSNSPARFAGDMGQDLGALTYAGDATPGLHGTLWTDTTVSGFNAVAGDLVVAPGATLTLAPGATLQFASTDVLACGRVGNLGELVVLGRLVAEGTPAERITLTSAVTGAGAWDGVTLGTDALASSIAYADVSNATTGLKVVSEAGHTIAHDTFSGNRYGVSVEAGNPTMDAITLSGNTYGVWLQAAGGITLTNATIVSNSFGVRAIPEVRFTPVVVNLTNCTLHANGTGISASSSGGTANVNVVNSIVTGSMNYGVFRSSGLVTVTYSNVWGNGTDYSGVTAGTGCISEDPMYSSAPGDLSLQQGSAAIDAGTATGAPALDPLGTGRPVDGDGLNGAQVDMGAYEWAGLCAGVACTALDACHAAGTCDPLTGLCSDPEQPDGTPCGDYVCSGGACLTSCASDDDCAGGYECTGTTCTEIKTETREATGSGCSSAGATSALAWVGLLALAMVGRRRRARG